MMELVQFYRQSSSAEKSQLKQLIDSGKKSEAWALIQQVTGVKLQGAEFATEQELTEGWRDWVAGTALALGVLGANAGNIVSHVVDPGDTIYSIARANAVSPEVLFKLNGFNKSTKLKPGQHVKVPDLFQDKATVKKSTTKNAPVTDKKSSAPAAVSAHEKLVTNTARKNGITGVQLAAFLAQVAHESHNFQSMVEYGGSLDFRKYDPKYAPGKAKILGNTRPGDGAKYKGRGFIQITGKYNYKKAGEAIGVDLVKNPKLAEDPAIAAKIAVWYWKTRVQPNVTDWHDIKSVTDPINPGLRGLPDRLEKFKKYLYAQNTGSRPDLFVSGSANQDDKSKQV